MCKERMDFLEDVAELTKQSCFPMPEEYTKTNATLVLYMLEKVWREEDTFREGATKVWKIIKSGFNNPRRDPWDL